MGGGARRSIREELLSVPGVAGAEFDGDPVVPEGVRVRLTPGADADDVGREVKRVLADHGMRSHVTPQAVAPRRPPPPPEPRTVINLAEFVPGPVGRSGRTGPAPSALPRREQQNPDEAVTREPESDEVEARYEPSRSAPVEPAVDPVVRADDSSGLEFEMPSHSVPVLGEVAVTQRGRGVVVRVGGGDRVVRRVAVATEDGIDLALLDAICELLGVSPVPRVVAVTETDLSGSSIVSVLVDDGLVRRSGSAVYSGNRVWTVAQAFWSAVSGPA